MGITNRRKMRERKAQLRKTTVNKVQKATPMQKVKEAFGSKLALAEKVAPLIEKRDGEEEVDFNKRISTLSNTKLLKLYNTANDINKSFSSKDALADAVYKKVCGDKGKVDQDYLNKLKTFSLGKLWDMYRFYKRNK